MELRTEARMCHKYKSKFRLDLDTFISSDERMQTKIRGEFEEDNSLLATIDYFRPWIFRLKKRDVYRFANQRINILETLRSISHESSIRPALHEWTYAIVRDISGERDRHK